MKITAFANRNLTILSISLGLLFFGFNAAEQHFTAYYQDIGLRDLAFQSLAILYASIMVGNFLGPTLVRKLGVRMSFFLGYLTYAVLVFGITTKFPWLIYLLSFLLGVGAGVAGIARAEFLYLIAPKLKRGEYSGATESVRTFGGFLGIASVGLILRFLTTDELFLLFGSIMLVGVGLLLLLASLPAHDPATIEAKTPHLMTKLALSPKILLLLPYSVAGGFLLGLVLGAIPAMISKEYGIGWVGPITSLFHLTLAIVLLSAGYLSDVKGRFGLIYSSIVVSILATIIYLNFSSLPMLALVMIMLGLGGSLAGGAFSALMLDTFEKDIKEASAVLGNLSLILGVIPSFLLPQVLSQSQLIWIALAVSVIGLVGVTLFQTKYSLSQQAVQNR